MLRELVEGDIDGALGTSGGELLGATHIDQEGTSGDGLSQGLFALGRLC